MKTRAQLYAAGVIFLCLVLWSVGVWAFLSVKENSEEPKQILITLWVGLNICFPFIYFLFCFLSCFSFVNRRFLKIGGIIVHLLLIPLFPLVILLWLMPLVLLLPCSIAWYLMYLIRIENEKPIQSVEPMAGSSSNSLRSINP